MEELDLLKKAWQKDSHKYEQVSENDIYKMLHKKSSSIVKWILIISIIEVLFWAGISVFFNIDDYLIKMHAESLIVYFKVINFINYAVILVFIYSFYKNYVKISTTATTKQLMHDILKTRKTVQYYVWYNLAMALVSIIASFVMQFTYNPKMEMLKYRIEHEENHLILLKTCGIMLLFIVIFVFAFWLFYRILYGILLRKLNTNYKELKKIDL
jgi:ABC-type multidrug transport system fused ATPase/permease subunit